MRRIDFVKGGNNSLFVEQHFTSGKKGEHRHTALHKTRRILACAARMFP